jgi:hypothetical protein
LPSWLWHEQNEASIKKRIKAALAQHKDDAKADPVREFEERTNQKLADMEKKIDKLVRKFLPEDATTEEPNTTPALEAEGILDQITEAGEL